VAFLTVKTESVKQEGESGYLNKSGIYDLVLKHAEVKRTANGATQINYIFDKVMSFGNTILGVNGQPTFGYKVIESAAAVLGESELSDPEPVSVKFKKGSKELNCIPELTDVNVKAWIQFEYRMYNGNVQENVVVKRFYRATDGASGSEVVAQDAGEKVTIGERLEKDSAVAETVKYDGVTAEAVAAWKKASMSGSGDTPAAPAKKAAAFPGASKPSGFPTGN